ncbi:MAG TPA: UDP-N-acetylmuramoyl-L-alanyl-D-glutamate--2,6-diaminopimelate ligase [Nocardioidaceae bacterium]|nr:UDP-N-acetylmuramoyl-L-alanyl-D-glutamate--2,6-diaminopimelate ligase [Nocardioidaceae bacterium]
MRTRPDDPLRTPLATIEAYLGDDLVQVVGDPAGVEVTGVTLNSTAAQPGDLFAAPPGTRVHGASYAEQAVASGAVAVLTDAEGAGLARDAGVPLLVVPSPRAVLGSLAAKVYGEPALDLRLVAVTGTQGKTTTTRLAESALQASGQRAAVVGTVGTRIDGQDVKTALTTPEAPDLQALFAVMREQGVHGCAMEVSSHALVMGRVDGVVFDVAAFTNLGRDHLDFHADEEEYFQAKAQLFTAARARLGLVNIDDAHGRRLLDEASIPMRTYSTTWTADWQAVDIDADAASSAFTVLRDGSEVVRATVPLAGSFNVSNALCAIAALGEAGFDPADVGSAMGRGGGVPGRLERVDAGQPFLAVVDYAHKPDAVTAVLEALRPQTKGRLIIVLGAGGDRDQGKRPIMGEIASRLADVLVVTDDNPRSEDPAAIRAAVLAGATGSADVHEVGDRREAIRLAVSLAREGDVVVIAGKGHESGQEVDGVVTPFDDREVLHEELNRL